MLVTRQCIACRSISPIDRLWRFIRQPDGLVEFDPKNQLYGRGAYICQKDECLKQAIQRKAFTRAFKKPILGISMPNGESTRT